MKVSQGSKARAVALVTAWSLVPAAAFAWTQQASFETHIHGHEFSHVSVDSNQCELKVRVLFTAPEAAYKNENSAKNFYRFHARIKLDGHEVVTRVFSNSAPGTRGYNYSLDTTADACWAKDERKLQGIDIEGCRGAGCTPDPFK